MIKHGLIFDRDLYNNIKGLTDVRSISTDIIFRSVEIKNEVITQDPTEKGLRKILNFGHTIGHAIEGFSLFNDDQPPLHGEAIAVGMICEGYLSHKMTGLSKEELDDLIATFRNHYPDYRISIENYDEFIALMKNDKKNAGSKIGFALLTGIGSCTYDHYVEEELIIESLDFYRELIS